jgi:hypothetical protein
MSITTDPKDREDLCTMRTAMRAATSQHARLVLKNRHGRLANEEFAEAVEQVRLRAHTHLPESTEVPFVRARLHLDKMVQHAREVAGRKE